jgi:signal transduction histidine kinase
MGVAAHPRGALMRLLGFTDRRPMSPGIARRMVVASALQLLVVSTAFAVLLISDADLRSSAWSARHSQEVLTAASQLERLVVDLETGQRGFILTGEERFLEPWQAARVALSAQASGLERLVADDPAQQDRAQRITRKATSYLTDYSMPLLDTARRDPASARSDAATEEGRRRMDAMRADFDDLISTERRVALQRQARADMVAGRAVMAAAAGLVGSILLIVGFAVYLRRAIVGPVLGTAAMAERLAGGDLSARVPETGVGELRTLERSFNAMADRLGRARAELAASRARIITSADDARRRIERDLHDGIQQRLVSLTLDLRSIQASPLTDAAELQPRLDRVADGLALALDELREISRGIHPAILSSGGLGPALKTLARRAAIPVEVDVKINSRFPPPVEVASYFVVSEALTNAAKHARASLAQVSVESRDGRLYLSVRDNGSGGANPARGTGLIGLTDRVQALGGTITIHSPLGEGTNLCVDLPTAPT